MSRFFGCLVSIALAMLLVGAAGAQEAPQKSPFGVPMPPGVTQGMAPTSVSREPPGLFERAWFWILGEQQRVNRELVSAVKRMKSGDMLGGTLLLAFLSFMYGVLHAAGPGHGKAIISSYVLANERTLKRGIMLSFLAALIQALSAIAVVGVLAIVLNATSLEIKATEAWIETVSWAFVALVGLWLLSGEVRKLWGRYGAGRSSTERSHGAAALASDRGAHHAHSHIAHAHDAHSHGEGCGCGHAHTDHDHSTSGQRTVDRDRAGGAVADAPRVIAGRGGVISKPRVALAEAAHDHQHGEGEVCSACGHAHMPDPKALGGELSWTKALAIAFSVGIRPCTGAILVLIFSLSQGILLAGVFSAFAMALGTAITVSVLASLALGSRELATRMAGADSGWAGVVASGAAVLGSTLVFLMGASFFVASLNGSAPL